MNKGNISINAHIFCFWWDKKIIHAIFSYIFSSLSNYIRCENTLAHWFSKVSSDIYGGFRKTLNDIQTESERLIFPFSACPQNNDHSQQKV